MTIPGLAKATENIVVSACKIIIGWLPSIYKWLIFGRQVSKYKKGILNTSVLPEWQMGNRHETVKPEDFLRTHFANPEASITRPQGINFKQLQDQMVNTNAQLLIVGEAGVGKTTLCHLLSKNMTGKEFPKKLVPVVLLLRNFEKSDLVEPMTYLVPKLNMTIGDLLKKVKRRHYKIVLFLDGLNELSDEARMKIAAAFGENPADIKNLSMLVTSRTIGVSERLCGRFGNNLQIYEQQRWGIRKLRSYMRQNSLDAISRLKDENLDVLRLPLIASLYVRNKISVVNVPISMGSIFDSFLTSATKGKDEIDWLRSLAFEMTVRETTTTTGRELEQIVGKDKFKDFCLNMINEGVLSSVEYTSFDDKVKIQTLQKLRLMFLHQTLQEHLSASYLLYNEEWKGEDVPRELSTNAFWREVPMYAIDLIDQEEKTGPQQASRLICKFLERGDFWTSARLVKKLKDHEIRKQIVDKINNRLFDSLSMANAYANAAKTFREIGEPSVIKLTQMIESSTSLEQILAVPEFHMFPKEKTDKVRNNYGPDDESIEKEWRRMGRIITILGELGNKRLVALLLEKLDRIASRHLTYHALESILLVLQSDYTPQLFSKVKKKLDTLKWTEHEDPIIAAYATVFVGRWEPKVDVSVKPLVSDRLAEFLRNQIERTSDPHFNNKFWQRAHGFLVLAEIATSHEMLEISRLGLEVECNSSLTPYVGIAFEGHKAVLPAITTGILRMQHREGLKFKQLREIVERMLFSDRFAESQWACAKIEDLLLNVCNRKQIHWAKDMATKELPKGTRRIIDNLTFVLNV